MIFKIKVDDFWLEEEELSHALSSHIKNSVVVDIKKSIQKQIDEKITKKVTEMIEEKLGEVIDTKMTEVMSAGLIKRNGVEISINDHVRELFVSNRDWNSPNNHIEKIAKEFATECKLQYNNVFAGKVVSNMKEQGLLRDDVAKMLLEGSSK